MRGGQVAVKTFLQVFDAVDVIKIITPGSANTMYVCACVSFSFVVVMAVSVTSGTETSKLLPTQDTNQK